MSFEKEELLNGLFDEEEQVTDEEVEDVEEVEDEVTEEVEQEEFESEEDETEEDVEEEVEEDNEDEEDEEDEEIESEKYKKMLEEKDKELRLLQSAKDREISELHKKLAFIEGKLETLAVNKQEEEVEEEEIPFDEDTAQWIERQVEKRVMQILEEKAQDIFPKAEEELKKRKMKEVEETWYKDLQAFEILEKKGRLSENESLNMKDFIEKNFQKYRDNLNPKLIEDAYDFAIGKKVVKKPQTQKENLSKISKSKKKVVKKKKKYLTKEDYLSDMF